MKDKLLDAEDEVSRLESALTLLQMAATNPCIGKEEGNALEIGIAHAMEHAVEIRAQLIALQDRVACIRAGEGEA